MLKWLHNIVTFRHKPVRKNLKLKSQNCEDNFITIFCALHEKKTKDVNFISLYNALFNWKRIVGNKQKHNRWKNQQKIESHKVCYHIRSISCYSLLRNISWQNKKESLTQVNFILRLNEYLAQLMSLDSEEMNLSDFSRKKCYIYSLSKWLTKNSKYTLAMHWPLRFQFSNTGRYGIPCLDWTCMVCWHYQYGLYKCVVLDWWILKPPTNTP